MKMQMAVLCRIISCFAFCLILCCGIVTCAERNLQSNGTSDVTSEVIDQNCTAAFDHFSKTLLNFTQCSIEYARPIRVCMKCSDAHSAVVKAYNQLKQQTAECQAYFFGSDQLGVVDVMYSTVMSLWTKSSCQSCYSHLNETKTFFRASQQYMDCITTNWSAVNESNSTCEECEPAYVNLTKSFQKFVSWEKNFDEKICMDIIDAMNISRRMWKDYSCFVIFGTDIGFPNVLTALTVGATPVMFYLLAKNISRLEDVKIVRPKRKLFSTVVAPPPSMEQ